MIGKLKTLTKIVGGIGAIMTGIGVAIATPVVFWQIDKKDQQINEFKVKENIATKKIKQREKTVEEWNLAKTQLLKAKNEFQAQEDNLKNKDKLEEDLKNENTKNTELNYNLNDEIELLVKKAKDFHKEIGLLKWGLSIVNPHSLDQSKKIVKLEALIKELRQKIADKEDKTTKTS